MSTYWKSKLNEDRLRVQEELTGLRKIPSTRHRSRMSFIFQVGEDLFNLHHDNGKGPAQGNRSHRGLSEVLLHSKMIELGIPEDGWE